jgi:formylglycine-generating enzyme required for sulfatase activity
MESDIHVYNPMEYHADVSPLVQMLRKGHHGVTLGEEAWDRLITWIDLNTPCYGTWREAAEANPRKTFPEKYFARRHELDARYANLHVDREEIIEPDPIPSEPVVPKPVARPPVEVSCPDWPLTTEQATTLQAGTGGEIRRNEVLVERKGRTPAIAIDLVRIPAGSFVMGANDDAPDAYPPHKATIERPFWMSAREVSLALFRLFKSSHDNGTFNGHGLHFNGLPKIDSRGNGSVPVLRVTWEEAMAFCRWLSERTGKTYTLPTEVQWEWACRAGTATPFWYGDGDTDYKGMANFAELRGGGYGTTYCLIDGTILPSTVYDGRFKDGHGLVAGTVRGWPQPMQESNVWGLYDMHGNVAEWTLSAYRPYPYDPSDGREQPEGTARRVVRGGSFTDVARWGASSYRLDYQPWQRVHNVGFRVVCLDEPEVK